MGWKTKQKLTLALIRVHFDASTGCFHIRELTMLEKFWGSIFNFAVHSFGNAFAVGILQWLRQNICMWNSGANTQSASAFSHGSIQRGFSRPYSANIKPIFHILIVAPRCEYTQSHGECVWRKELRQPPLYKTLFFGIWLGASFAAAPGSRPKINNKQHGKTFRRSQHWLSISVLFWLKRKLQSHFAQSR